MKNLSYKGIKRRIYLTGKLQLLIKSNSQNNLGKNQEKVIRQGPQKNEDEL